MSYAIAAYGITLVALIGYGIHLVRERKRLSRGQK
jgi:heme exporter protein D